MKVTTWSHRNPWNDYGRITQNPWTHHGNTPISVMWPRNSLQCKLMTLMFRGTHTDWNGSTQIETGICVYHCHCHLLALEQLPWTQQGQFKCFSETTPGFELSPRGRLARWNGDPCVSHGTSASLTCIGANSVATSRKSACFRDVSTDFELFVRSHFTDSCETRLISDHSMNIERFNTYININKSLTSRLYSWTKKFEFTLKMVFHLCDEQQPLVVDNVTVPVTSLV